jgi:hypothetical protein
MRVKYSLQVAREPTLDRPLAAQANVFGAKHLAHAPTAQRHRDAMVRNRFADHLDSGAAIVNKSAHARKTSREPRELAPSIRDSRDIRSV